MGHSTIFTLLFVAMMSITAWAQTVHKPLSLTVYPNPTENYTDVTSNIKITINKVHLMNIIGTEIKLDSRSTLNEEENILHIDLSGLYSGIYIISLTDTTNGNKATEKLIVR